MKKSFIIFSIIIFFSACSKKSDNPTPIPTPTPNPGGGTGTCQGFTCKNFFVLNAQWEQSDSTINLGHPIIYTITSGSDLTKKFYNGTVDVLAQGTFLSTDCLKMNLNVDNGDHYVLKFKDANTVYLVSQSVDYNSIDWSKAHTFYKRIK